MKKTSVVLLLLCTTLFSFGQILEPIKWYFSTKDVSSSEKELLFKATIDNGWHLYGTDIPEGGPISTSFDFMEIKGAKLIGKPKADKTPIFKYDNQFDMELNWFEKEVTFVQKIQLTAEEYEIKGELRFMACNDETCLHPTPEEFTFKGKVTPTKLSEVAAIKKETQKKVDTVVEEVVLVDETPALAQANKSANANAEIIDETSVSLWEPVIDDLNSFGNEPVSEDASLLWILITGFLGGLFALITPCVWPMIPMTVSFFLKRTKDRQRSEERSVGKEG